MKMELIPQGLGGGPLILELSHGNEKQQWDVSLYAPRSSEKAAQLDDVRLFEEINGYWAWIPMDRQLAIWQIYTKIRDVLDNNFDIAALHQKLQTLVKQLYDTMPLAEIRHWRAFHSRVRIPNSVKEEYGPDDNHVRTYLRADYVDLVALAIAVRPMVPIWGEYINSTRRETGNVFKELMALSLLYYTKLQNPDPASPDPDPMERLRMFVEAVMRNTMSEKGPSATAILGGLGSVEQPDWVMALTVVRRLAIGEISAADDTSHIVTNIFNYIGSTLRSTDKKIGGKFGGKVNEKNPPSNSTAEEANASIVEMYKVTQEVSDGAKVTLNVYTRQTLTMAQRIWPEIDTNKLGLCLQAAQNLARQPIHDHHTVLVQWVMAPCLPPRGVPLLAKPALLRTIGVTQAVLWEWGFYDLAVMASATPLPTHRGEMIASLESRTRIPKDLMEELQVLYPHYAQPRGKQYTTRQSNVAARAIDEYCELIARTDWQLHAPAELINLSSRLPNTKKLIIPSDIRAQLARLIIRIARST